MSDLRPKDTIQKALISTTSRFVGEYEHKDLLIAHAWPDYTRIPSQLTLTENPLCRNAFVVAFRTELVEKKSVRLLNYSPIVEDLCAYLSVLYGKRFDNHGLLENTGIFQRPDMGLEFGFCTPHFPQNSHSPRKDLNIPLNLAEFKKVAPLVFAETMDTKFIHITSTASQFYLQALQNFEKHPETAYLNLITCGEVLSAFYNYKKDELLDSEARSLIQVIEGGMENGAIIASQVKERLLQVKRRFIKTITDLVNEYFFMHSESAEKFGALKKDDFEHRIAAAYDLRSKYVHTGIPFGRWVSLFGIEIQVGKPVVENQEYGKVLAKAPTYFGLERIMRFCLLRFIHLNGVKIDPHLN